jgi:hypothetical protein
MIIQLIPWYEGDVDLIVYSVTTGTHKMNNCKEKHIHMHFHFKCVMTFASLYIYVHAV